MTALIQPFPPGMALPARGGTMPGATIPKRPRGPVADCEPFAPAIDVDVARLRDRRRALAARIAALPPRSRKRAELLGRLRELTLEALRLEAPGRPSTGSGPRHEG